MGRAHGSRRGPIRRTAELAGLLALIVPFTTACSVEEVLRFGWPVGVTPQATQMRELWTYSAIAALVVGVITWGAMAWTVTFHRKRKGSDDAPPRQTQYNVPVEIVFTVIPTIIVAILFGFTVSVQNYVEVDEPDPDVRINTVAFQWNWRFEYPQTPGVDGEPVATLGTSDTIPLLVLPTDQRIEFTQRSNDVIHSFFVPEFLFKRDVFPMPEANDQDNVWQVDRIETEGAFVGRCAELCGSYHSQMNFEVRAIAPADYAEWLTLRASVNEATGAPYTAGEALAEIGCEFCAPQSVTTFPFDTDRTAREAATRPIAGG